MGTCKHLNFFHSLLTRNACTDVLKLNNLAPLNKNERCICNFSGWSEHVLYVVYFIITNLMFNFQRQKWIRSHIRCSLAQKI